MKKILIMLVLLVSLMGCTGINSTVSPTISSMTDTAFVIALQLHPEYKAPVVLALTNVKKFLATPVTYDALLAEITKQFPAPYAFLGTLLAGYIGTDTPYITSAINMLDSYKAAVNVKIDKFLALAGTAKG